MKPYYADEQVTLLLGDTLDVLRDMPDESVDCVARLDPDAIQPLDQQVQFLALGENMRRHSPSPDGLITPSSAADIRLFVLDALRFAWKVLAVAERETCLRLRTLNPQVGKQNSKRLGRDAIAALPVVQGFSTGCGRVLHDDGSTKGLAQQGRDLRRDLLETDPLAVCRRAELPSDPLTVGRASDAYRAIRVNRTSEVRRHCGIDFHVTNSTWGR